MIHNVGLLCMRTHIYVMRVSLLQYSVEGNAARQYSLSRCESASYFITFKRPFFSVHDVCWAR